MQACPFCQPPPTAVFHEDELVLGIWDAFPVTPGHALLITRRHVADWFDATAAEQHALLRGLDVARGSVLSREAVDGFNIGVNVGAAAGQTVPHLHVHLIPRVHGDVPDPRGGVRWVVPERAAWWSKARDD